MSRKHNDVVSGAFVNCRYYDAASHGGVDCKKHGAKKNCAWCPTCPKCGARHYVSKTHVIQAFNRNHAVSLACPICSNRIEMDYEPDFWPGRKIVHQPERDEKKGKYPERCAVVGCKSRTWDRNKFDGVLICDHHRDQTRTWRKGGLSKERFPLIWVLGKLIENPKYKKPILSKTQRGRG